MGSTATRSAVNTSVNVVSSSDIQPLASETCPCEWCMHGGAAHVLRELRVAKAALVRERVQLRRARRREHTLPPSRTCSSRATPTLSSAAPKMAPAICAAMYIMRRRRESLPISHRLVDTTGLKCAPLRTGQAGTSTRVCE